MTNKHGDEHVGEFRNSKPHGKGVMTTFGTKDKIVGEWKDGEPCGELKEILNDEVN